MRSMMMVVVTLWIGGVKWGLWAYKMGFGTPLVGQFVGDPRTVLGANALTGQAGIPNLDNAASMPSLSRGGFFNFPGAALVYFQFVFAPITPILFIAPLLART